MSAARPGAAGRSRRPGPPSPPQPPASSSPAAPRARLAPLAAAAALTDNLPGLQSALIKAGVPAIVRAAAPVSACTYQPAASALEPPAVQRAVVVRKEVSAGEYKGQEFFTDLYIFDPSAMPKGSVVFIADRNGPRSYGTPDPVVLTSDTVPPCNG